MFGVYDLDMSLKENGIEIEVSKKVYRRKSGNEEVEKKIYADKGEIIISPVPPVNLPSPISKHLLIETEKSIFIEPKVKKSIFLKFPLEIGVFISDEKDIEPIDIFTKTKIKYTLYGRPEDGYVCRLWKSDVYEEIPDFDKSLEGLMKLKIINNYIEWVEIQKIIFNSINMKIFYSDYVFSSANLELMKKELGKTYFDEKVDGMKEGIDLYTAKSRKLGIIISREIAKEFFMERGFK